MQIKLTIAAVIGALVTMPSFATDPTPAQRKTVTSVSYVDTQIATKQPKLAGNGTDTAVTYPIQTGGTPSSRTINGSLGTSLQDTGLATTGAINTALNAKQGIISGAANTVITYGSSDGATGSKPVYQANGSYNANALAEVQHVNSTVVNGFNEHLTCANPPDCTLWNVNNLSGTYVPHN